jgi:hypothetical protein
MTREKLINLSKNLISDKDNYMSSFHKNMDMYVSQPDLTIREIAELSGLPFSTINTFLYGSSKDCKLSTAVSLAKAMKVSIDELIGCDTLSDEERAILQDFRSLAPRTKYLIRWFIDFQKTMLESSEHEKDRYIAVMDPRMDADGNLFPTNNYTFINIKDCTKEIKSQVFLGISVTCSNYMPNYSPYDILLIANDRPPKLNEDCVILLCGKLYLAKRVQTMEGIVFHSIRDGQPCVTEAELDSIIGYVAGVKLDYSYLSI